MSVLEDLHDQLVGEILAVRWEVPGELIPHGVSHVAAGLIADRLLKNGWQRQILTN